MHRSSPAAFHFLRLALVLLLAVGLGACVPATPAATTTPPTVLPPVPSATRTPLPVATVDPYIQFAQQLKQAVENSDEMLLRETFGAPWLTGRYRATLTQYTVVAEAVAAYRVIRQRAASVVLEPERTVAQPADLQRIGDRILPARWDPGTGREEIAYFYASLVDGEWLCVGLVLGVSSDVVLAQASPTVSGTQPATPSSVPTSAATVVPATPTRAPTAAAPRGRVVFARGSSVIARDLATGAEKTVLGSGDASQWDWTADGARAVLVRGTSAASEIWSVNRDGTGARRLTSDGIADAAPRWSPDGAQIVYVHNARIDPVARLPFKGEVWAMNADGGNKRKLADGFDPQWAPDGQRLAFASNPASVQGDAASWLSWSKNSIRIVNAQGKNEWSPISTDTKSGKFTPLEWTMSSARLLDNPQWAPDGRELTLRVHGGHGAYVTTHSTNGGFATFINLFFDDTARGFSYSPDGRYIIFETGGLSGFRTFGVFRRADIGTDGVGAPYRTLGKAPRAPGDVPQSALAYAWSPDGARIAYALAAPNADVSRPPVPAGIWIMDLATGAAQQLNADGASVLAWLP